MWAASDENGGTWVAEEGDTWSSLWLDAYGIEATDNYVRDLLQKAGYNVGLAVIPDQTMLPLLPELNGVYKAAGMDLTPLRLNNSIGFGIHMTAAHYSAGNMVFDLLNLDIGCQIQGPKLSNNLNESSKWAPGSVGLAFSAEVSTVKGTANLPIGPVDVTLGFQHGYGASFNLGFIPGKAKPYGLSFSKGPGISIGITP